MIEVAGEDGLSVFCRLPSVVCYRRTLVFLILPKIGGQAFCDEGFAVLGKGIEPRNRVQISAVIWPLATDDWKLTSDFWFLRKRSSDLKEHLVDALACTGDEGRGTLR